MSTARPGAGRAVGRFRAVRRGHKLRMADPAPIGSDVSAGRYRCTNCRYELDTSSTTHLPPCPNCGGPNEWEGVTGGDSGDDPYPER